MSSAQSQPDSSQIQMLATVLRPLESRFDHSADHPLEMTADQRHVIQRITIASKSAADAPERSLVSFKATLNQAADDARLPFGPERSGLLSRFVRFFIEEFYRSDTNGAAAEDGACRGKTCGRTPESFAERG
jgi:hypothetical protein